MKPLSRPMFASLLAVLAAVMLMTRFEHFGSALHLPDASMAVFFLGGLWLRRHRAFIGLVLLAVVIDEVSIHYLGISDFCVTAAYAFLPAAYAVLWYAGRAWSVRLQPTLPSLAGTFAVALVATALSFAISNGSFYWLGGRYAHPHMAEYVARLWQWGPLFAGAALSYVVVGLAGYAVLTRLQQRQTTQAHA